MNVARDHNAQLFHALHADGLLLLANCWDAGTARMATHAGSKALATSSAAVAWSHGYADGSQLPPDLLLATVRGIRRTSALPLTVDIENGYADAPADVAALTRDLVHAGVVGINIEDGADSPELLCEKIAAVRQAAAADGVQLYINARTDIWLRSPAPPESRVRETLRRAALYRNAGASGLFVPGVTAESDIADLAQGCGMPLNVLVRPGFPSLERLLQLGVRRLSAGSDISEMAFSHIRHAMDHFLESGAIVAPQTPVLNYPTINGIMRTPR